MVPPYRRITARHDPGSTPSIGRGRSGRHRHRSRRSPDVPAVPQRRNSDRLRRITEVSTNNHGSRTTRGCDAAQPLSRSAAGRTGQDQLGPVGDLGLPGHAGVLSGRWLCQCTIHRATGAAPAGWIRRRFVRLLWPTTVFVAFGAIGAAVAVAAGTDSAGAGSGRLARFCPAVVPARVSRADRGDTDAAGGAPALGTGGTRGAGGAGRAGRCGGWVPICRCSVSPNTRWCGVRPTGGGSLGRTAC